MASFLLKMISIFWFVSVFANSWIANAGDPDITSDYIVPANVTKVDANLFTFTGFRGFLDTNTTSLNTIAANKENFPILDGQSVSMAVAQFPAGTIVGPHIHPRSAELLLVIKGSFEVGFVDTTNKLFTQTLQTGDVIVIPKGMMHYAYNVEGKPPAVAVVSFASANPGFLSLPPALFATGIDDEILAKSFLTDVDTIKKIKAGFGSKA